LAGCAHEGRPELASANTVPVVLSLGSEEIEARPIALPPDPSDTGTLEELEKRCEGGDARACAPASDRHHAKGEDPRAVELAERGCKAGGVRACYELGLFYRDHVAPAADPRRATQLLEQTCEQGLAVGCYELAVLLGKNGLANDNAARSFYRRGCDGSVGPSCVLEAFMILRGRGGPHDQTLATRRLERACELNEAIGCGELAMILDRSGAHDLQSKRRILDLLERACVLGDGRSCVRLGAAIELENPNPSAPKERAAMAYGLGCDAGVAESCARAKRPPPSQARGQLPEDQRKAVFDAACKGGLAFGCAALGLEYTVEPNRDDAGASGLFERACTADQGAGCLYLALLSREGRLAGPRDEARELRLLELGCSVGNGGACGQAAVTHLFARKDGGAFWERIHAGCRLDDGLSCHYLAVTLMETEKEPETVTPLFEKACDLGYVAGCSAAAENYRDGRLVVRDPVRAFQLFQRACDGSRGQACDDLASMVGSGLGTGSSDPTGAKRLYQRAASLYRPSCERNDMEDCVRLGILYSRGRGVDQDESRSAVLFEQACQRNEMSGCFFLGLALMEGKGVAADHNRGKSLIKQACDAQFEPACAAVRAQ
jgi:TPR repeat protein